MKFTATTFEQFFEKDSWHLWWQRFPHDSAIFLDIETTGLSPLLHDIIEIGCYKLERVGALGSGTVSYGATLLKPQRSISQENFNIHGITNEMVASAPVLEEIFSEFIHFLGPAPILGHNIQFDLAFLLHEFLKHGKTPPKNPIYDTCVLARQFSKFHKAHAFSSHKLDFVSQALGIEHHAHRAAQDALVSAQVCLQLIAQSDPALLPLFWPQKCFVFEWSVVGFEEVQTLGMCDKKNNIFATLAHAIEHNQAVEIRYEGGSHGLEFRPIKPIAFLPLPSGTVIHAACLKAELLYKNFYVQKIKDIRAGSNI